jgi:lysylphosphatidylglycerol synthetase-like protein (DUF2156 family)
MAPANDPMDARHRWIQIFGWLSVIAGYGLALLLIRGIFIGITRGFSGRPQAFWVLVGYLLFLATAVYMFAVGRRAISNANGRPRPTVRFGWGRMLLGALLIYGTATTQFHLLPTRHFVKQLEYENEAQATAGNVTTVALCIGCVFLILGGIWKGFRQQTVKPVNTKPDQRV